MSEDRVDAVLDKIIDALENGADPGKPFNLTELVRLSAAFSSALNGMLLAAEAKVTAKGNAR